MYVVERVSVVFFGVGEVSLRVVVACQSFGDARLDDEFSCFRGEDGAAVDRSGWVSFNLFFEVARVCLVGGEDDEAVVASCPGAD